MTLRPASIDDLRAVVREHPRLRVRGGGTKPGLSGSGAGDTVLDLSVLSGIVEHTPEECTFTALAGTRLAEIEERLGAHEQYLPFDPPLVDAGATLGGATAAGANGSCRYRYGGARDFLIGARIVDGRGQLVRSGGKVVKNAAGLLLHQGMVGSCGRFGVLAELTFKVFPRAPAHATIRAEAGGVEAALGLMTSVLRARLDLDAIDIDSGSALLVRVAGFAEGLPARVEAVQRALGVAAASEVLSGDRDSAVWREAREFGWAPAGCALVRVPLTLPRVPDLERALHATSAVRRYALAGNVAFVAWPGDVAELSRQLAGLALTGQVLIGPAGRPFIGAVAANDFDRRVREVMDPEGRFAPVPT